MLCRSVKHYSDFRFFRCFLNYWEVWQIPYFLIKFLNISYVTFIYIYFLVNVRYFWIFPQLFFSASKSFGGHYIFIMEHRGKAFLRYGNRVTSICLRYYVKDSFILPFVIHRNLTLTVNATVMFLNFLFPRRFAMYH